MNKKKLITAGVICCIIAAILLAISIPKIIEANDFIDMGEKYGFGSTHDNAWNDNLAEAKIPMWIGVVFLVIGGIMAVVGFCISDVDGKHDRQEPQKFEATISKKDVTTSMRELSVLYESNLISEEEYQKKRAELLERL